MNNGPYVLGIDIGGTGSKAELFTLDGQVVGAGYGEYGMINNRPGQAEQNAEAWWEETVKAIRAAIHEIDAKEVLAVGIGCTNGLVAVGNDGNPLHPAIMLWDQRAVLEVDRIRHILTPERVFTITGNPVAPGTYYLPTILWLKNSLPDLFKSTYKLLVPGGFIVAKLTGEFTMDFSRACTTLLFDIKRNDWHVPFLEALEIPAEKLPRLSPSQEVVGEIKSEAARVTGLLEGTPVVAGCTDTLGASVGSGVLRPGEGFIIMGTAARVCTPKSVPHFDRRFMNFPHVLKDLWLAVGANNGVGSSLRWIRDTFAHMEQIVAEYSGQDVYDLLTSQASRAPVGSKGLIFLPYISGERTPIWNPFARGVFFGVSLSHGRNDILRSVLEGSAFAMRQTVEILEHWEAVNFNQWKIGGIAAKSSVWTQIIADVIGKPLVRIKHPNTEVLGAAMVAGVGVGAFPDYDTAQQQMVFVDRVFTPDLKAHHAYSQLFSIYKNLYMDIEPHFERLAKLDLPDAWVS